MKAVEFQNISLGEFLTGVSFSVESGSLSTLITSNQDENDLIVRLLLGLATPDGGTMTVLGDDPSASGQLSLRRRIGVLHPSGGLVSNLKVAENVALPLAYHSRFTEQELARRCDALLHRVGYHGRPMELPGNLSLYCRRLVGQARAFIMDPELVLYNAVLGGLSEEERRRIVSNAVAFHRERPGRTSLFLTSQPETMGGVPLDARLTLEEKSSI